MTGRRSRTTRRWAALSTRCAWSIRSCSAKRSKFARLGAGHERILDAVSADLRARTQDATAVRYEAQERYIRKLKAFNLEEAAGSHSSQIRAKV